MMTDVVAVVVPYYNRVLSPDEEISFRHLRHFLGEYPIYLIAPQGLKIDCPDFRIKRFDDKFFRDVFSFSKFMLSRQFYEPFIEYKYMLIYQLDGLVFSDQLRPWCEMDFDYIGAPWLKFKDRPNQGFSRVGNGGFSLRKIENFLKVIDSRRYLRERQPYWKDLFFAPLYDIQNLNMPRRFLKRLRVFREVRKGVGSYLSRYTLNEDRFWSDRARLFYPDFKIAPVEVALRFSFEAAPRYCFERNNYRLPFGCHGWTKWDRNFWEDHLLK